MTKKKEEKTKEEIKTVDLKNIETEIDKYFEDKKNKIEDELSTKIDEQVEFKVTKRLKEEERRLNRGKNGKIIRRDIVIILLLVAIGYFGYCLYEVDYFNIRTKIVIEAPKNEDKKNEDNQDSSDEPIVDNKPDSGYYIENYSYLIDNLMINDEIVFKMFNNEITRENIANELKLKIAFKNLNPEYLMEDKGMLSFSETSLLESAQNIFGENIILNNEMFNYNNIKFMYYNETYLGLKEEEIPTNLVFKITNAKEEDNTIIFELIVGKIIDNNLINLNDEVIIEEYNKDDLLEYQQQLSRFQVNFEKINDNYIFQGINKSLD